MRYRLAAALLMIPLAAALAAAAPGPGPGDPFRGDDTGCVPATRSRLTCSGRITKAKSTLVAAVAKCHIKRADARYKELVLDRPPVADDDGCEAVAQGKLAAAFEKLAASGMCTGSSALASAAAEATTLLADATNPLSLDARHGAVYCDAISGIAIDPSGDDAGFVPPTKDALSCADRVAKALGTLTRAGLECHRKAGDRGFRLADPPFDEEACEANALAKYDAVSAGLVAQAICPACLGAAEQHSLGTDTLDWLDGANAAAYPCPDDVLHLGVAQLDRPTLMTVGVQLLISGDDDHDAAVAVRYRPTGDLTWREALPLFRVRPESVGDRVVPAQFAGSIFDLRPATTYEIELHATDPDGPVDTMLPLNATTRGVPQDPVAPNAIAVSDTASLRAALAAARAGDVITLADGIYGGPFVLAAGGTAANPIVIHGTSRDGTVLHGGACSGCNVLEVYGSFVHVERLTLQAATRGLRFQSPGAEGNVVRRVHVRDVTLGIGARPDQRDFYLCDNLLEGPLQWPHVYTDDGGDHADDDGIRVEGHGHVVCHNQIVGFGDAIKNGQRGARALDVYGNEVLSAYDNGTELDLSEGNVRCMRNRFTNTFATLSFQPVYGGPAYVVRNVVVNVAHEQMKFHGLGGSSEPSGVLVYHNTFVSPARALFLSTSATSHHFTIENNLFVGPTLLTGTRTVDWLGPVDHGLFDYDGYFPDGSFRFNLPPAELVSFTSFAALQAAGMETGGVLLAEPIFASGLVAPAAYTTTLAPQDVTLDAASNAVDSGLVLPNLGDGFTGGAPDLGALERGCPLPIFGVRPEGTDESNEPLGCAGSRS